MQPRPSPRALRRRRCITWSFALSIGIIFAATFGRQSRSTVVGEQKSAFELEWEEKIEAFSVEERRSLLAILKRSLKTKTAK